ncbi:uncharacterized protein LOC127753160 isoform X2 [Oryza glaberrima]|uniref:uncharacterized protein LOC127753160 isoform X2 n=1 Tax=Oryza glaberrima TaxID=4538 RepID=UPI00224C4D7D|nr:uncharacterized protein LOC127753160 isoform X2 [Oryza glaberrima]
MVAEAAFPPLPPSLPHRSGWREGGPRPQRRRRRPQRRRRVFSTLRLATPRAAVAPSAIYLLPPAAVVAAVVASAVAAAVALAAAADGWCRRRPRMDDVAATTDGWRGNDRGRRWQRPRAAVAMANGGSGGRREKFCDGATSVPPTIGSSKRIVRRAISLLPPTTLPALPTTTPTRATAEATHRAEEASQVYRFVFPSYLCSPLLTALQDTKAPSLRFCK